MMLELDSMFVCCFMSGLGLVSADLFPGPFPKIDPIKFPIPRSWVVFRLSRALLLGDYYLLRSDASCLLSFYFMFCIGPFAFVCDFYFVIGLISRALSFSFYGELDFLF